jgi:hypothetical protein
LLTSIAWEDRELIFNLEAEAHSELHCHAFAVRIVVTNATLIQSINELPSEITDAEIRSPGHSSYSVLLRLPFGLAHPCELAFTLSSGNTILAAGDSCRAEVGQLIRTAPIVFDL